MILAGCALYLVFAAAFYLYAARTALNSVEATPVLTLVKNEGSGDETSLAA